jgi:hypothetical protein
MLVERNGGVGQSTLFYRRNLLFCRGNVGPEFAGPLNQGEGHMSKFSIAVLGVFFGLVGAVSEAKAITTQCDGCTEAQMQDIAWSRLYEMRSNGPLYVVDLYGGITRKYLFATDWGPESNPETDPYNIWAEEASVEPAIQSMVQQVGVHLRAMAATQTIYVNPSPEMPSDVFQAINQSSWDYELDVYIRSMTNAEDRNQAIDLLSTFTGGGSFFNVQNLYVSIKLYWSDGSSSLFAWDSQTQSFKRQPGTERDGEGNEVPQTPQATVGETYTYENVAYDLNNQDDFYDMWSRLLNMGVPVVDMRGGMSGTFTAIFCTADGCQIVLAQ